MLPTHAFGSPDMTSTLSIRHGNTFRARCDSGVCMFSSFHQKQCWYRKKISEWRWSRSL